MVRYCLREVNFKCGGDGDGGGSIVVVVVVVVVVVMVWYRKSSRFCN